MGTIGSLSVVGCRSKTSRLVLRMKRILQFQRENPANPALGMMQAWLPQSTATLQALTAALDDIGQNAIAEKLTQTNMLPVAPTMQSRSLEVFFRTKLVFLLNNIYWKIGKLVRSSAA